MGIEEDTYNTIFKAMQHPIRRRILRSLSEAPSTYTEIQRTLNIDNGLLNYHLEAMNSLITKNEEGSYTLSEFGKATVNLVRGVEEPVAKDEEKRRLKHAHTVNLALLAAILIVTLSLAWIYVDTNSRLSALTNVSDAQKAKINGLEFKINDYSEAWQLVNITSAYSHGVMRAQVTFEGVYASAFTKIMINNTKAMDGYLHEFEAAYIYAPRNNVTLRIVASLRETTRNIPIVVFRGTDDIASHYSKPPLFSLEAKPEVYNEFNIVLPEMGWYSVSSYRSVLYTDPKYDYYIRVAMWISDGGTDIPFVIRSFKPL